MIHARTPVAIAIALGAALLLPSCSALDGASADAKCVAASGHVVDTGTKALSAVNTATEDVTGGAVYDTTKSDAVAEDFQNASSQMADVATKLDDFAKVSSGDVSEAASTASSQWATISDDYQQFGDAIRAHDIARSKQLASTMSGDLDAASGSFHTIADAIRAHAKDLNPSFCG